jgi:hypothetical protein
MAVGLGSEKVCVGITVGMGVYMAVEMVIAFRDFCLFSCDGNISRRIAGT